MSCRVLLRLCYRMLSAAAMCLALAVAPSCASAQNPTATDNASAVAAEPAAAFEVVALRGRVVWMGEALKRRFGIESDPDAAQTQAALETTDGQVLPLVKDARGRGFWLDGRIRDRDLELLVRRYRGTPALKIIRVYAFEDGEKYELDYWCDICSIPMYELKPCECCQGETRIRLRKIDDKNQP
ncbi:MAG: hypothetical protein K1X74_11750 [Pirellulales bacterium]|nr:hypothetical protein [Pirellulales bacterium]